MFHTIQFQIQNFPSIKDKIDYAASNKGLL